MNDLTLKFDFLLVGVALMLLLMGLGVAIFVPVIDRWSKRFFIAFFSILLLYVGLILTEEIIGSRPGTETVVEIFYYFDTLLISLLLPLLMAYLLHCCGESLRHSRLFRLELALWIGFFLMLNLTPFTTWFYYLSSEDQFLYGSLYPLMTGFLFVMTLLILGNVIRQRSRLPARYYHAFLIGLIPMATSMLIHFFVPAFVLFGFSIIICASSMYVIILADQIEKDLRRQREIARQQQEITHQQQEIAHQRVNVMVLQMRPHFIYNTLMSIYSLCNQDPQKARQVTMDFTNYLRKNFNAIASDSIIPFSEELEHTRAYLAVEQAQFEEILLVEYDTPFTRFRVPPLTLQPIAENAVKHGMNPYAGPLHVFIRTRHTDAGSVITVEDDGSGFDPANIYEPHNALTNIRQRLDMMCGGKLEVTPRDGGGTTVTVTIPSRGTES